MGLSPWYPTTKANRRHLIFLICLTALADRIPRAEFRAARRCAQILARRRTENRRHQAPAHHPDAPHQTDSISRKPGPRVPRRHVRRVFRRSRLWLHPGGRRNGRREPPPGYARRTARPLHPRRPKLPVEARRHDRYSAVHSLPAPARTRRPHPGPTENQRRHASLVAGLDPTNHARRNARPPARSRASESRSGRGRLLVGGEPASTRTRRWRKRRRKAAPWPIPATWFRSRPRARTPTISCIASMERTASRPAWSSTRATRMFIS